MKDFYDKLYWRFTKNYWQMSWSNFKYTIWAHFKLHKAIKKIRPWDYEGILHMLKEQVSAISCLIENHGNEVDETRLPKVERMKRFVELVDNQINSDFQERCGVDYGKIKFNFVETERKSKDGEELYEMLSEYKDGYTEEMHNKFSKKANKLEEKEWNELMDILKNDLRGWWD